MTPGPSSWPSSAAMLLVLLGYSLGRAATPRPSPVIPDEAFGPVLLAVGGEVPASRLDQARTGVPQFVSGPVESNPAYRAIGAVPLGGTPSPESATSPRAPGSISAAKAYALRILGPREYACLDAIVEHESRWNPLARNRVSGAFGIPQALHGLTSPDPLVQVRWMLDYVARRYGTACAAWSHVLETGWY